MILARRLTNCFLVSCILLVFAIPAHPQEFTSFDIATNPYSFGAAVSDDLRDDELQYRSRSVMLSEK